MTHFTADACQFRGGGQIDKSTFFAIASGVAFQAFTIGGVVLVWIQRSPFLFKFLHARLKGLKGLAVYTERPVQNLSLMAATALIAHIGWIGQQGIEM